MADRILTPKARLSFPALFKARAYDESKAGKYECDLIFPKSADLKALKVMCATALREKCGPDAMNLTESENGVAKPGSKGKLRWPIRDGAEKTDKDGKARDGYGPDTVYIKVSSKNKPGIVDQNADRITDAGDEPFKIDLERAAVHNTTRVQPFRDVCEYVEEQIAGLNEGRRWGNAWSRFARLEA